MAPATETLIAILWITVHGGPIDGTIYGVPFMNEAACKLAIVPISNSLDYDHNLECEVVPVEVEMLP
jgi:hypothetical protein